MIFNGGLLQVSTYQMSMLLQFNSSSELRLSHLQISTQLSDVCSNVAIYVHLKGDSPPAAHE